MPSSLILDSDPGGHGSTVQLYFDNDAPNNWTSYIFDLSSNTISDGVDKAINDGYELIIRSETGLWDYKDEWKRAWDNEILTVHAHGSNSLTELDEPPYFPEYVVPVGGEDPNSGSEERSFGRGLEIDAEAYDGSTAQSWATPTIAAAIARQYNRGYSLQEARLFVRQSADSYSQGWNKEEGYGVFVSGSSISKSGLDIHDPYAIEITDEGRGYIKVDFDQQEYDQNQTRKTRFYVDGNLVGSSENNPPFRYYKTKDHSLKVVSSDNDGNESVGLNHDNISPSNIDIIDRDHLKFVDNEPTYDKNIPDGFSIELELRENYGGDWGVWKEKDEIPRGHSKMRIKLYADYSDSPVFTSEEFDVTNA